MKNNQDMLPPRRKLGKILGLGLVCLLAAAVCALAIRGTSEATTDGSLFNLPATSGNGKSKVYAAAADRIIPVEPSTKTVGSKVYYLIGSREELLWFANQVSERRNTSINGVLTADITFNDTDGWEEWSPANEPAHTWTALGTESNPYTGVFNGNSCSISGLYISNDNKSQGMFGYVNGGTVKNLGIDKSYIRGGTAVGGVVGTIETGRVENCYNSGIVAGRYCGGVVGAVLDSCTVSGNYNTGNVYSTNYAGGVFGYVTAGCRVENNSNTGAVCGVNYVGGIIGHAGTKEGSLSINNCYSNGKLAATGNYVGGLVGVAEVESSNGVLKINNSYSYSTIISEGSTIGGIIGCPINSGSVQIEHSRYYTDKNAAICGTGEGTTPKTTDCSGFANTASAKAELADFLNNGTKDNIGFKKWLVGADGLPYFDASSIPEVWSGETDEEPAYENGYYLIGNAGELAWFAAKVNSGSTKINGRLTAHIRLNYTEDFEKWTDTNAPANEWTPMNDFRGDFDGDGYSISGIYISTDRDNQGLFSHVSTGSKIHDLTIAKSYVKGGNETGALTGSSYAYAVSNVKITDCVISGKNRTGGISGYLIYATDNVKITNCIITGKNSTGGIAGVINGDTLMDSYVVSCRVSGEKYTGGLAGDVSDLKIQNCGSEACQISGAAYTGGVVGSGGATIAGCYNKSTVEATAGCTGGVIGYLDNKGDIKDCYNTGTVNVVITSTDWRDSIGGVAGVTYCRTPMSGCYNTGNVTVESTIAEIVDEIGGVVGYVGTIFDCYNTGTINVSSTSTGKINEVGGVVGSVSNGNRIENCYNLGDVNVSATAGGDVGGVVGQLYYRVIATRCRNAGSINGKSTIGGIVGYMRPGAGIDDCHNSGEVNGRANVGGITGYYFTGDMMKNCSNTGDVTGTSAVGGICGYFWFKEYTLLANCYNAGVVSGSGDSIGGLIGYLENSDNTLIINNYNVGSVMGSGTSKGTIVGYIDEKNSLSTIRHCKFLTADGLPMVGKQEDGTSIAGEYCTFTSSDEDKIALKKYLNEYSMLGTDYKAWNRSDSANGGYPVFDENRDLAYWDGTMSEPQTQTIDGKSYYLIGSSYELAWFANEVNANKKLNINGMLTADIKLNETANWNTRLASSAPTNSWTPICASENSYYSGTFDGGGHTVAGIYVNSTGIDGASAGLFGNTSSAVIKNIGIVDSYINGSSYAGGLIGRSLKTSIMNSFSTAEVRGQYAGGISGYAKSESGALAILNCYNKGSVYGSAGSGGIAGFAGTIITNCYNVGTISGASGAAVGNICGYAGATSDCQVEITFCHYPDNDYGVYGARSAGTDYIDPTVLKCVVFESTAVGKDALLRAMNAAANGRSGYYGWLRDSNDIKNDGYPVLVEIWNGTTSEITPQKAPDDYYLITNGRELAWFAAQVNGGNVAIEARMIRDICLNNINNLQNWETSAPSNSWTPVGRYVSSKDWSKAFCGTFDGNGNVIAGLYINNSAGRNLGLFGFVNEGKIKNLGMVLGYVRGEGNVASLIGYDRKGYTTYCFNECTISGVAGDSNSGSIGGIVGYQYMGDTENCRNSGLLRNGKDVGGIVGHADYSVDIKECYNTAKISECNGTVGGVVGYLGRYSEILGCYNTGDVSGKNDVGGISGHIEKGNILNCYNGGLISYTASGSGSTIGGIAGYIGDTGTVNNCYNTGTVSAVSNVGGMVGYADRKTAVSNCYNIGSIKRASGTAMSFGAICGYMGDNGKIDNCKYLEGGFAESGNGFASIDGESFTSSDEDKTELLKSLNGWAKAGGTDCNAWTKDAAVNNGYPVFAESRDILSKYKQRQTLSAAELETLKKSATTGETTITVPSASGFEFSTDGKTWLTAINQTDVLHGNKYTIYARKKETSSYYASAKAAFSVRTSAPVWSGGTKQPTYSSGYYLISCGEELAWFRNKVNSGSTNINGKLIADIKLNDTSNWQNWGSSAPKNSWGSIGYYYFDNASFTEVNPKFQGTFDGNGHTVSGIYKKATSYYYDPFSDLGYTNYGTYVCDDYNYGLFGCTSGAVIKNLGVTESWISGQIVGGIVGEATNGTTIKNCYYSGSIGSVDNISCTIGGIVGEMSGGGGIYNCYNSATINNSGGGIVGRCYTNESSATINIANCYNVGSFSGNHCGICQLADCYKGAINIIGCKYLAGNGDSGLNGRSTNGTVAPTVANCGTFTSSAADKNALLAFLNANVTTDNGYKKWKIDGAQNNGYPVFED